MSDSLSDLQLRVTDDSMAALLDCELPAGNMDLLLTRIEAELKALNAAKTPDRQWLEEWLRKASEKGPRLLNETLLEGLKPVPPQDGRIEWAEDFFSPGFAVDAKTGVIDYRQRVARAMVEADQLLARATRAKEGRDGRDIFGRQVSVARPKQACIFAGQNVRAERKEDGIFYYSKTKGRARWASNTLSVDEIYRIPGSVGMETGNINHPGAIVVEGDVLAGSRVEAAGDIEVMGTVEASDISAGGNLTVRRGITGTGNDPIKVHGSVHAKFILEAQVEADEDIVVESEIIQSSVKTRGALTMPAGRLVGGSAMALGGIAIGQAGSGGLVPTLLIAAEDYCLNEKVSRIKIEMPKLTRNLEKIHKTVDPLMAREKALSPNQREAATELLARASEMETEIGKLRGEMEQANEESRTRAKPRIFITRKVFPETTLRIMNRSLSIAEAVNGPVQAGLKGARVVLLSTDKRKEPPANPERWEDTLENEYES